jgi:hypothetical protein
VKGELRRPHPDLLRRFVPAPYVFGKSHGKKNICVESNDLEIALGIRQAGVALRQISQSEPGFFKIIRDLDAPADLGEISIIAAGALTVLQMGRGTILIHDRERAELLGFISCKVTVPDLVSLLLPTLLSA